MFVVHGRSRAPGWGRLSRCCRLLVIASACIIKFNNIECCVAAAAEAVPEPPAAAAAAPPLGPAPTAVGASDFLFILKE